MPKPVTFPQGAAVRGGVGAETAPAMSRSEKLHLQVFRVQIKLNTLGRYQGQITGKLDDETKRAVPERKGAAGKWPYEH